MVSLHKCSSQNLCVVSRLFTIFSMKPTPLESKVFSTKSSLPDTQKFAIVYVMHFAKHELLLGAYGKSQLIFHPQEIRFCLLHFHKSHFKMQLLK